MSKQITISDDLHDRLELLSGGLFSLEEVIERLEASRSDRKTSPAGPPEEASANGTDRSELRPLATRSPRERGVTVKLDGQLIEAETVRDLYEQALKYLVDGHHIDAVSKHIPFRTSNRRYLIARKPEHPNGNKFFVPVSYGGYWMETHKNYETAIKQLGVLVKKAGLGFQCIG
jgi:hypothetical protein